MRINRKTIKLNAKNVMADNRKIHLAALIVLVVILVAEYLIFKLSGIITMYSNYYQLLLNGVDPSSALIEFSASGQSGWLSLLDIVLGIFVSLLQAGFTIMALRLCRRAVAGLATLLDGFGIILRVIGLEIMIGIFTFLWSLLFIIPGIIASYRYRLALYLLVENPDYGVMQCIRESKRLMRGRKGELFVLDLSFIGWDFLSCILPVMIYTMPYFEATYANYYIAVKDLDESAPKRADN